MQKKTKILLVPVCVAVVTVAAYFILFYPWIKLAEATGSTCKRCGSNKTLYIHFGKWNVETNRQEVITFQGPGFDSCTHKWVPGHSQTNLPPDRQQENDTDI